MPTEIDGFLEAQYRLLKLAPILGSTFGTEHLGQLLHILVRMHRPRIVVELGTGAGWTTLWLALGAAMNHVGHVFSVDDLELFRRDENALPAVLDALHLAGFDA